MLEYFGIFLNFPWNPDKMFSRQKSHRDRLQATWQLLDRLQATWQLLDFKLYSPRYLHLKY